MIQYVTVTPPAALPVSTAEAKSHLRVSGSSEDTLIASMVEAATDLLERHTRRSFITQTIDLVADAPPGREVVLRRGPVASVTAVYVTPRDGDEEEFEAADYLTDLRGDGYGRIVLRSGAWWPADLEVVNAFRVRYVAGYGAAGSAVPEGIRQAVLLQVAEWYENRGDDIATGQVGGEVVLGAAAQRAALPFKVHRL